MNKDKANALAGSKHRHFLAYVGSVAFFLTATVLLFFYLYQWPTAPAYPTTSVPAESLAPVEPPVSFVKPVEVPKEQASVFSAGSFTDIFSGNGWINTEKTTLYHDLMVGAFMFEPKFEWQKYDGELSSSHIFTDTADTRCLNLGGSQSCLGQKGVSLYFANGAGALFSEGNKIALPAELLEKRLVNLSIGGLTTRWVVGAVTDEGKYGKYKGYVFTYDGQNYKKIIAPGGDSDISSMYEGALGFGGVDNDWISIYGGADGIAYRVRNDIVSENVSYLFRPKLMRDGFHPDALMADDSSGRKVWYVYSMTRGRPVFIKVFQNANEISGAVDYTPLLNLNKDTDLLEAVSIKETHSVLIKATDKSGDTQNWQFQDLGFDKSKSGSAYSLDVVAGSSAGTRGIRIKNMIFPRGGGSADFSVSNDGENWKKTSVGKLIGLDESRGKGVYWRMDARPDGDSYTTIFLKQINLEYDILFSRPAIR